MPRFDEALIDVPMRTLDALDMKFKAAHETGVITVDGERFVREHTCRPIVHNRDSYADCLECSECHKPMDGSSHRYPGYCSHCGAKVVDE